MKDAFFAALLISMFSVVFGVLVGAQFAVFGIRQDCQKIGAFHSERVVYDCKERK